MTSDTPTGGMPERIWVSRNNDPTVNGFSYGDWCEIRDEDNDGDTQYVPATALAAAIAERDALRAALDSLVKAATEVNRYGAQTGSQWTHLGVALLKARAALAPKEPPHGNG